MSWFRLSLQGKDCLSLHQQISSICTGSAISTYAFETLLKHNPVNMRIRKAVVEQLSRVIAPQLMPISKEATEKILLISLQKEKLVYLTYKLKDKFMESPRENLMAITKQSAHMLASSARNTVGMIPNPFVKSEKSGSESLLPSSQSKEEAITFYAFVRPEDAKNIVGLIKQQKFSEAVHQMILSSLRPVCEKAVQQSILSLTKAGSEQAYDYTLKKMLSIVLVPAIYSIGLKAFEWAVEESDGTSYFHGLDLDAVPRPSTILAVSAVGNALQMGRAIWKESRKEHDRYDLDKEEVKKLALKHAKKPVLQKLQENKVLLFTGVLQKPENVELIVETLINETIELYWNDLHQTKVLGLPLVS